MKRTATFLVILASLLAALLAIGAVASQTKIVQLIGGETAEIQCDGNSLEIRKISGTQVVAWCVPATGSTPTQEPIDTPMPTDMPVSLIGDETAEIQCDGESLAIRRISGTQAVAWCVPAVMPTPTQVPTATPVSTPISTPAPPLGLPAPYGVDYPSESDFPYLTTLNVKLVKMSTGSPQAALALLDTVNGYGMRAILRISGAGDWSWNGSQFNLSSLANYEQVIGGHPALFAVYGLHEPWERFSAAQLRTFYSQWKAVAPSLPVWHDIGYLPSDFTDGICDVCAISSYPHRWEGDNPVNDYDRRVRRKIQRAQAQIQADPDATLCVALQAYGASAGSGKPWRMPTVDEMREHASIVFGELGVTCGTWYAYYHSGYDYVLGAPQLDGQRGVVAETYDLYFVE